MPIQISLQRGTRVSSRQNRRPADFRSQPRQVAVASGFLGGAITMRGWRARAVLVGAFAVTIFGVSAAQNTAYAKKKTQPNEASVARGKYLVEGVARCGQCHTPRDAAGDPARSHTL